MDPRGIQPTSILVLILLVLVQVQGSFSSDPPEIRGDPPDEGRPMTETRLPPLNGSTVDLRVIPNYSVQVNLPSELGGTGSRLGFKVNVPLDYGVLVVVRSMKGGRGVPGADTRVTKCYLSMRGRSTAWTTHACTFIMDKDYTGGFQAFAEKVSKPVDIDLYFRNEELVGPSMEEIGGSSNTIFVVDVTSISDCSTKSEQGPQFQCSPTLCIAAALQCDGNLNCPYEPRMPRWNTSWDELNCASSKVNGTDEALWASSSSTVKPPRTPFDMNVPQWQWWNQNQKAETTTTTGKPAWVIHYYDHDHRHGSDRSSAYDEKTGDYVGGWAQQVPLIGVLVIFLAVSLLIFLTCSVLARLNTRKHSAAAGGRATRRPDLNGIPNLYSIPAPEGRVYFYPDAGNRAYMHTRTTPPPPPYHDAGLPESPPSYNALFKKSHSSLPSNLVAAAPAPATIAVSPPLDASTRSPTSS